MRSLHRDRRFVTYWTGHAVSEVGDRISELALPLIAIAILDASSIEVGVLTAAIWAPQLLSLLTGAWVDQRPSKRRILIASDLLQAAAVATIPLAWWLGWLSLAQLVAVALVAGAGRTLSQTAYPSFFVSLVTREQYVEANSLLSTTRSASSVAGPAIGGALIQVLGAPVTMIIDAFSFLVSAVTTGRVNLTEPPPVVQPAPLMRRAGEGFRYLVRHPYLAASLRCCTTLNFFSFVLTALVVLYASRALDLSAGVIGLAFGIGAGGAVVGALVAGRTARRIGTGHTIALGGVLFTAPYAALPLAVELGWNGAVVLALVEAVSGFGIILFDINLNALQTAVTSEHMRSRVAGAFATINYGIRPFGAVVGGVMGTVVGIAPTLVAASVGGTLSILWLLRSPIMTAKTIDDLQPVA